MDLSKFFNIFSSQEKEIESEITDQGDFIFNEDTPLFKVGMFVKLSEFKEVVLITNHPNSKDILGQELTFYLDEGIEITDENEDEFNVVINTMRYKYLKDLDPEAEIVKDSLLMWTNRSIDKHLQDCLEYYESVEEYLNCSKLKKMIDYIEANPLDITPNSNI